MIASSPLAVEGGHVRFTPRPQEPVAAAVLLRLGHRRGVFVTMGGGVNARTAFSLLFPPIVVQAAVR
ncbi:MAG: hypothetical protein ACJ8AH_15235 [Stellaceae bacterium]